MLPSELGLDGILNLFKFILPAPPIPRVGGDNTEIFVPVDLAAYWEGVDCELEFAEGAAVATVGRATENAGAEVTVDLEARERGGVETGKSVVLLLYTIPVPILDLFRRMSEVLFGAGSGGLDGVVEEGSGYDFLGMAKPDLNDEGGGPESPLLMFKGCE